MSKYPNGGKVTTNNSESSKGNEVNMLWNEGISQIYLSSELVIHEAVHDNNVFNLYASSSLDYGRCPYCGHVSSQVHSRYFRTLQDMSILGKRVVLHLEVRKFFCHNADCQKKTFAEQPGDEVFRYRRRTCRCERTVARHGISVSSSSASHLLAHMGISVSPSTILRDLHKISTPEYVNVEVVGVDDWAWRKGVTYGSILIDYANGLPIDLLGDRETESFHGWLERHEKVRMVSRDRSTDYSSAIASTGRHITEVADKFHLVKNITDRMKKLVAENYADYRKAARCGVNELAYTVVTSDSPSPIGHSSQKSDPRKVTFKEVKELQRKGFKPTSIAKKLGISRQTATKYCKMDSLPERNSKLRNEYYKYDAYVEREAVSGKALSTIHQEICQMGFSGSRTPFYDHYKYLCDGHRGYRSKNWKPDPKKAKPQDDRSKLLPVKSIALVIDKAMKGRNLNELSQKTFNTLMSLNWFREMYEAMENFCKIIKGNETVELVKWMKRYWKTNISSLKTFIIGIKRDYQAVRNTIRLNITNGITEGFVNKLKVVKRSMYGRAGLELMKNKLVLEHVLFN